MERINGLTEREATLIMAALSRNNPILPIRAVDQKDLKAKFIITAWLLAEERLRPNFLAGALLKINTVGGYIPDIQHINWIVWDADTRVVNYRTGSGNPDFRDHGGRVVEILRRMEWVIRKGGEYYDRNARLFIEYHNLGFVAILVRILEEAVNSGKYAEDGNSILSDINYVINHYINEVPFETHYPLSRFNRKADRLLAEQCGEAYDLLMPASREAIVDNIRWYCPSDKDSALYAAVENGTVQFRMERKAQNVRWVEVTFDDVTYNFEIEVVTDF